MAVSDSVSAKPLIEKEVRESAEAQVRRMRDENPVSDTAFYPLLLFC